MSDEKQFEFELYIQSSQKFDYYIAGIAATFSAFFAHNMDSIPLGFDSKTIEFLGVILLITSLLSGLLRIERSSTVVRLNHEKNNRTRSLWKAEKMIPGQKMKHLTEEREMADKELIDYKERLKEKSREIHQAMARHIKIATGASKVRNIALIFGLILVLGAKVIGTR